MPFEPDDERAELPDRLISAAIAAFCGWLLGMAVAFLAGLLWGGSGLIAWLITLGAALFGFFEPYQSRALWTDFWSGILAFMGRRP